MWKTPAADNLQQALSLCAFTAHAFLQRKNSPTRDCISKGVKYIKGK